MQTVVIPVHRTSNPNFEVYRWLALLPPERSPAFSSGISCAHGCAPYLPIQPCHAGFPLYPPVDSEFDLQWQQLGIKSIQLFASEVDEIPLIKGNKYILMINLSILCERRLTVFVNLPIPKLLFILLP